MDVLEWHRMDWKDTGNDQTLEQVVRGLLMRTRRGKLRNMNALVRRLERAIKVIDDSGVVVEPKTYLPKLS